MENKFEEEFGLSLGNLATHEIVKPDSPKMYINNVLAFAQLSCKVDLNHIAMSCRNTEYNSK